MRYRIVESNYSEEFSDKVNDLLIDGWKLKVGFSVSMSTRYHEIIRGVASRVESSSDYIFVQAMIKE